MMRSVRRIVVVFWVLVSSLVVLAACSKAGDEATRYHCPMHPTYVSDAPGDCPICGMRLVPIKEDKKEASTKPPKQAPSQPEATSAVGDGGARAAGTVWTCPMHPEIVKDAPGRCPICKMKLEPKRGGATAAPGVPGLVPIDVSPEGLRLAGVRTAIAEQGRIARTIRAVGIVRADERRIRHVHTKISGWIEKLYVNFTGEPVTKGKPILSIFSPELLAAQHEYLQARSAASSASGSSFAIARDGADTMVRAARRRLELFDVPPKFIEELEQTGAVRRTVTLAAPAGGIAMSKNTFEGQQVDPGMELFTVSDLSSVWIEADVYESESAAVHVGLEGTITLPQNGASPMKGKIQYIYPYLNAETRTLRVRFTFPNPDLELKLDSYVNVEMPVETDQGVIVPESAVMDTGVRQVVFVNPSEGRFEPRLVKVGIRAEGKAQVAHGLEPGERVAIKANFLLDSESRLKAALGDVPSPSAPPEHVGSHP